MLEPSRAPKDRYVWLMFVLVCMLSKLSPKSFKKHKVAALLALMSDGQLRLSMFVSLYVYKHMKR